MSTDEPTTLKQLKEIFLDTFLDDSYEFSIETTSDDIEEWDSLNHIRLLTAIEAEFGVQFDIREIEQISSVATTVELLLKKTS